MYCAVIPRQLCRMGGLHRRWSTKGPSCLLSELTRWYWRCRSSAAPRGCLPGIRWTRSIRSHLPTWTSDAAPPCRCTLEDIPGKSVFSSTHKSRPCGSLRAIMFPAYSLAFVLRPRIFSFCPSFRRHQTLVIPVPWRSWRKGCTCEMTAEARWWLSSLGFLEPSQARLGEREVGCLHRRPAHRLYGLEAARYRQSWRYWREESQFKS